MRKSLIDDAPHVQPLLGAALGGRWRTVIHFDTFFHFHPHTRSLAHTHTQLCAMAAQGNWKWNLSGRNEGENVEFYFSIKLAVFLFLTENVRTRHTSTAKKEETDFVFVIPYLTTNDSTSNLKSVWVFISIDFFFIWPHPLVLARACVRKHSRCQAPSDTGSGSSKHEWFFVLVGNLLINQTKHRENMFVVSDRTGTGREQAGGGQQN